MNDQNYQELQENITERTEELKQRACEIEEHISENVNELMNNTAEKLDKAAEKMQSTAKFFRENNANKIKEDLSTVVRKNPGKSLLGALALGFLINRALFK